MHRRKVRTLPHSSCTPLLAPGSPRLSHAHGLHAPPPRATVAKSCGARPLASRAEFQRREATFKRREEMLKKKDLELQESLIKFNKFLQENDSKRGRAEKKEKEEIKQRSLNEQEIVLLNEQLQRQKAQRDLMTLDLQKKMKYQYFLESVRAAASLDVARTGWCPRPVPAAGAHPPRALGRCWTRRRSSPRSRTCSRGTTRSTRRSAT